MKKLFLMFTLGILINYNAQLFISNNSYVMVSDAFVYSTGAVENAGSTSGSNIYLRRDGQLLQNAAATANAGTGSLSVYQEGTSSNFQHNAWCSPVGNPVGVAGNTNFGITLLRRPTSISGFDTPTITNGVDGTSTNSNLTISQRWINKYRNTTGYAGWTYVANATTIEPGEGFTMKGTSGTDNTEPFSGVGQNKTISSGAHSQRYEFRGRPNSGNVSMAIQTNRYILMGNPYPSVIDLADFIWENRNVIKAEIYYWEQSDSGSHALASYVGGYGTWTPGVNPLDPSYVANKAAFLAAVGAGNYTRPQFRLFNTDGSPASAAGSSGLGSNSLNRRFVPIGQGFMVIGSANGNVVINNGMRLFRKESADVNVNIRSNISQETICNETMGYIPSLNGIDYTNFKKIGNPKINLTTEINNLFVAPTAITFHPDNNDLFNAGADASGSSSAQTNFYLHPVGDPASPLTTFSTSFDFNKRIPAVFKNVTAEATFKIKVLNVQNCFDSTIPVYLYDSLTNQYHDIKNNSYSLTLPAGTHQGRFEITFTNGTLSSPENQINNGLIVTQNNDSHMLTLHNLNHLDIAEMTLFDVTGKRIFSQTSLGTDKEHGFSTESFQTGTYLVNVKTTDNINLKEKVIIHN